MCTGTTLAKEAYYHFRPTPEARKSLLLLMNAVVDGNVLRISDLCNAVLEAWPSHEENHFKVREDERSVSINQSASVHTDMYAKGRLGACHLGISDSHLTI